MNDPQQEKNNASQSTEVANWGSKTELTQEITREEIIQAVNSMPQRRPRNWQPGYELKNGKYIIEKELGRGGFGITYLATDYQGKPVVIKVLKDELLGRDDFSQLEEDFVNEAMKLSKCKHPNIVPIIKVINDGGWCIVMEYIKGKTLEAFVQERNYLSTKEALHYIKQIGEALKAVHAQGLLHRDVKPQNILIQEDTATAILIDFGLALKFNRNPMANSGGLSHGYAPLEQYQPNVIWDYYTDVYALAATLYFALTKTKPISAKKRASGEKLVSAKDLNPKISRSLNKVIDIGMSLDPASRPENIEKWLDLLQPKKTNLLIPKFLLPLFSLGLGLFVFLIVKPDDDLPIFTQENCIENDLHLLSRKCQKNHFFKGKKGDEITIEMSSDEIDPLLILMDANDNEIARNDDIDVNNFNARITQMLPADGRYRVSAQSSQKEELGAYTLRITKN